MTQGAIQALRRVQLGKESTPGDEVDATARLIGDGKLVEATQLVRPERDYGSLAGAIEAPVEVALESALAFSTDLSYEQILYALMTMDEVSGVSGNGAPYTWTFNSPDVTDPDGATFTLEGIATDAASNIEQVTAVYAFCTELGISAAFGANLSEHSATWVAKSLTAKAPTADPGIPSRTLIPADRWTVKLADTQAGLAGASALAGIVNSFDLSIVPPYYAKRRLSGSTEFAGRALRPSFMTLSIDYDLINTIETERTKFRSQAARFIRLAVTDGTNIIQVDMAGHIIEPPAEGEDEGQETREYTYVSFRDSTWGQAWQVAVTNSLAALP